MTDKTKVISMGIPWYFIIQIGLLIIHYGLKVNLPWWVIWFPTLFNGGIIATVLLVICIALAFSWIFSKITGR